MRNDRICYLNPLLSQSILMEFSTRTAMLMMSSIFSLCLMLCALYFENLYLTSTKLADVSTSATGFVRFLIIAVFILFFSSIAIFNVPDKFVFLAYIIHFSTMAVCQILMIIYGSFSIDSSISLYSTSWLQLGSDASLLAVESALSCCGYSDVLSSVASSCSHLTSCSTPIFASRNMRVYRLLAFTLSSVIFQIFNFLYTFSLKSNLPFHPAEFDNLVDTE